MDTIIIENAESKVIGEFDKDKIRTTNSPSFQDMIDKKLLTKNISRIYFESWFNSKIQSWETRYAKMVEMDAPEIILVNEKRMCEEQRAFKAKYLPEFIEYINSGTDDFKDVLKRFEELEIRFEELKNVKKAVE
ncbi:MAG: hypothetical protein LBM93_10160 [Oscillospiraceae bacterium]|nr:hypothetical protein [Oscillospiraceae bacterium]